MLTYPGLFTGVYNKKETLIGLLFKDITISDHVITKSDGIYNTVILCNDHTLTISLEIGRQEGTLIVDNEFSVSPKDCVILYSYDIDIKCNVGLNGVIYYDKYYDREAIMRRHTINEIITHER
jgi:hypothetical protein